MLKTAGIFLCLAWTGYLFSQNPQPPLVKNNYLQVTSYDELTSYIQSLDKVSGLLKVKTIGESVQGRNLYGLMFSSSRFGKDTSKITVMIFAQQHGNEQSGKEGALLLACDLLEPENRYLFDEIDLLLIPQVNPDGSAINERFNANGMDLNRNHLILSEPETMALHDLFDKYLFEVTMDVHEYYPYSDSWKAFGYRKNSDIMVGTTTNPNIAAVIRQLSEDDYLPYIFANLNSRGFSSFEYCPGGPPGSAYMRHSTFDINDGRQSLGIQHTFSFIQEGMNGEDSYTENLRHRAEGQMAGMRGLLEYAYLNKDKIRDIIHNERINLVQGKVDPMVSIQSEHAGNGEQLTIPLFSYFSETDSVVTVTDYRPVVRSIYNASRPLGYLIPKCSEILVEWAEKQSLEMAPFKENGDIRIEQYHIAGIDSIDFEGDTVVNPQVTIQEIQGPFSPGDYYFIPVTQLKSNLIILALEPKSMLGLITYREYAHLLKNNETYPILRVSRK